MSKLGSPVHQVKEAFRSVTKEGVSKHAEKAKHNGQSPYIHAWRTAKNYTEIGCAFVKFAGVRDIRTLTPEHGAAYLRHLQEHGGKGGQPGSAWTVKQAASALHKLELGIEARYGVKVSLLPADWVGPVRHEEDKKDIRAPYTREEMAKLLSAVSQRNPEMGTVCKVMAETGLRISSVIGHRDGMSGGRGIRVKDLDIEGCRVRNYGKGGHPTGWLQVSKETMAELKALANGKGRNERVFNVKYDQVRHEVVKVARQTKAEYRALHGFRYFFANARYQEYRQQGMSDLEARKALAKDLQHHRISVTRVYVPGVGWVTISASDA
ncbi:MAG: hypothetical protein ACM3XZ_00855 [Betaproteobacteria bacterium]